MLARAFGRSVVDVEKGELVARLPFAPDSIVQDDDVVVTLRDRARLAAFSLRDGAPLWEAALDRPSRQMTIDGGRAFVATPDALVAFDARTGTKSVVHDPGVGLLDRFAVHPDAIVVRLGDGDVRVLSADGTERGRVARERGERLANGNDHLLEARGAIAAVVLESLEHHFAVRGVAPDGRVAWRAEVEHSELLSRDAASGIYFFLDFEQATPSHLLFTSHWSTFRRPESVVLRIVDGARVAEIERHVSAIVERPDGALDGLLSVDQVRSELVFLDPGRPAKVRWAVRAPSATHRRADVALTSRGLLVAQYDAIEPSAKLVLLEPSEGLTLWQAEVLERPPFERKPLFVNAWSVTERDGRVVLLGDESAGSSAQVFDLADGRRLYSDLAI